MEKKVAVLTGAGQMGLALIRRTGSNCKILLADRNLDHAKNLAKSPAGRPGTADEIARLAEWMLSDKAACMSGTTVLMDGGAASDYLYGENE